MADMFPDEKKRSQSNVETSALHSRRRFSRPALVLLVFYSVIFIGALEYGRTHFYRDPGSAFFDPSRAYERYYSALRQSEAQDFVDIAQRHNSSLGTQSRPAARTSQVQICSAVMTTKRNIPRQYVYDTVGSLLASSTPQERSSLYLSVLHAESHPGPHSPSSQAWFSELMDDSYSYQSALSEADQAYLSDLEARGDLEEKGVFDYALALQRCLDKTSAPLIAVFEDDILVAQGWLARVLTGYRQVRQLMAEEPPESQQVFSSPDPGIADPGQTGWIYLRLFNQERSTGWASRKIGGNNELPISLGVSFILLTSLLLLRWKSPSLRSALTPATLGILCLLAIPSFVILFFQSGKASLLPPSPGLREEAFGCCSQALVFNRMYVPNLISYLREKRTGRYDMMTRDFAWEWDLKRFSLYPMSVQHVGKQKFFYVVVA